MMDTIQTGVRKTHNISLDPVESKALIHLAKQKYADGNGNLRRGAISWAVIDLLHEKMRAEVGRDWQEVIAGDASLEMALAS